MSDEDDQVVPFAPVKTHHDRRHGERGRVAWSVHLAAYEVYAAVEGAQPELVEGWCRGGFSTGELVAYLYARSFPRSEWRQRFREALKGCNL